jgi:hypothetical protein
MAVVAFTSNQITDLVAQYTPAAYFNLEVDIHVDSKIIKPFKVDAYKVEADYEQGVADVNLIRVLLQAADYDRFIYPFRNNLFLTIRLTPVGLLSESARATDSIRARKYRAIITENEDPELQGAPSYDPTQALREVVLQLFDESIDQIRLETIGLIASDIEPSKVLKAVVGSRAKALTLSKDNTLLGVDMFPPNEEKKLSHVIIPHGTLITDLAKYIQRYAGGVYKYGIGSYIYNQIWYIYPLFDPDRYDKSKRTLDVLMLPPNQRRGQDKTYAIKDGKVFIITTGETSQLDRKDINYQLEGNGTQFILASKAFEEFGETSANETTVDASKHTAQFLLDGRESGLQSTKFSSTRVTDNVFYEMSKKTKLQGQYMTITWENGDPNLLYPGMPIRAIVGSEGGEKILYGILLEKISYTTQTNPGVTGVQYRTNVYMKLFLVEKSNPVI